jgi:hypothetical protein
MKQILKMPMRQVMYAKDVMLITGKGRTSSRDLLNSVLKSFGKKRGQFVTVKEFSSYSGIDPETLYLFMSQ